LHQAPDEFFQGLKAPGVSGYHMLDATSKLAQFDIRLRPELDHKGTPGGQWPCCLR
jgi:hypothetical protein